ncbi:MAG: tetratricopeptide repeat protein [Spirochaetota bacterium]|nr:tetratricopeptide repeat protein [Spirochaetota bacterium]
MVKKKINPDEYIKKDTMYIIAIAAIITGFIFGVIYSKYISVSVRSVDSSSHTKQNRFPKTEPVNLMEDDITKLERAALRNPKNAEIWGQLGNLYFDANQVQKSIDAYKKSLELKSDNPNIWTDLGVMYRRNEQYVEAIAAFERAIEINPRHEISRLNKGIVLLYDFDDKESALKTWEALLKINPSIKNISGEPLADIVQKLKK